MTRIRATCPHCGEVDLRPTDVELEIVRAAGDEHDEVREGSEYRFCCPSCSDIISKPADARIARLLTTGGVAVQVTDPVAALGLEPHPEMAVGGPELTMDDLLDFHFALDGANWIDELAAHDWAV